MSTDRAELKTTRDHPDEFVEKFFCSMEKLKSHSYVAENQHKVSLSSLTYLELFCNRHWRSWKLNWKLAMWLLEVIIPYIYISIFQSLIIDENLLKDYHSVKFWSYAKSPSDSPPWQKTKTLQFFDILFLLGDFSENFSPCLRGEYMSKKIWNCLPSNLGILKLSVLINQKIFKTVYLNFLKTVYQSF